MQKVNDVGAPQSRVRRLRQLDALRGLAALTVIASHILASLPEWHTSSGARTFDHSPFRVLIAGRAAVALFFVLSGFVLALPFFAGKQGRYGPYAIRRFFRIYIPYIVAAGIALVAYGLLARSPLPDMSSWFNRHWEEPLTAGAIRDHLLLIGSFDAGQYGLVFWTLVHEMRISLLFPLLMLPVMYLPTARALAIGAAVSVVGVGWLRSTGGGIVGSTAPSVTLIVMFCFFVGAVLAKHRDALVRFFRGLTPIARGALLVGGWVLLLYSFLLRDLAQGGVGEAYEYWGLTVGSAVLILWAVASPRVERNLSAKPVARLGDISFSTYLFHAIAIYAVVHAFHGAAPRLLLLILSVPITFALAWLSFRYVELPSMRMGKSLSAALGSRMRTPDTVPAKPTALRPLAGTALLQRLG